MERIRQEISKERKDKNGRLKSNRITTSKTSNRST